jgi:hypothetical protein
LAITFSAISFCPVTSIAFVSVLAVSFAIVVAVFIRGLLLGLSVVGDLLKLIELCVSADAR